LEKIMREPKPFFRKQHYLGPDEQVASKSIMPSWQGVNGLRTRPPSAAGILRLPLIAAIKALVIALYFMEVRRSSSLTKPVIAAVLLWARNPILAVTGRLLDRRLALILVAFPV
jgi:hypothetical protein